MIEMVNQDAADLAVRCRDVVKTYGAAPNQVAALRGLDLDVRRGELTMIVGPSGCGKTSLISVIATLLGPDAGTCNVLGEDIWRFDTAARARFRNQAMGFVFQVFNLLPRMSGRSVLLRWLRCVRPRE
jgi:putative ABC transport system ATP-binding protein